jgi:hypothetical protein
MGRIIAALGAALLSLTPALVAAQEQAAGSPVTETRGDVLQLAPDAPDRYVVVKGDTLWGISSRYLLSPWNWPELWGMNLDEVKNPHLIYPGDILVLDRQARRLYLERGGQRVDTRAAAGSSEGRLSPQVYVLDNRGAIPSIPADAIQPFLTTPLVVEANELAGAPRVIGAQENRVVLGSGDRVFVSGLSASDQADWHFYRPGDPLRDPDSGEALGNEAIYLGDGTLERAGDPALLKIRRAKLEIGQGDRLITAKRSLLTNYVPRRAPAGFSGKVASIHGKGTVGGQYSVITLNRGRQSGLEVGHVVALERAGRVVGVRSEDRGFEQVALPSDRYALGFVFRTFDRIAYAIVLHAAVQVGVGDVAVAP